MSDNEKKCKKCGSEQLEEDAGMLVCTDCGTVARDSGRVLRHDDTQNDGMSDPRYAFMSGKRLRGQMLFEVKKRKRLETDEITSDARTVCSAAVDELSQRLCFTRDMKQELKAYVHQALSIEFYRSSRVKMVTIASICAYITVRRNGQPVTISEICAITKCEKQQFASLYYQYLAHYPQNNPGHQKLDQLIPGVLKGLSFHENEKVRIMKLTTELLQLLDQVMLIESKCPTFIILAAAFIAWKSFDCSRSAVSFAKFRLLTKIPADSRLKRVSMFVKQLEDRLISLSGSIPWISQSKLTRQNISQYVTEILQLKRTVVYDYKSRPESHISKAETSDAAQVVEDVDGDQDISDSEIDMYIRSSAEVSAIKRLRETTGNDQY